jgi:hypothetical protein
MITERTIRTHVQHYDSGCLRSDSIHCGQQLTLLTTDATDFSEMIKGKGKAVPLQAWSAPEGSRKLWFPDFMTTQDGGKVVSLTHRPSLPSGSTPGTHFC